jgi:DNA polymerase sigma
MPTLRAPRPTSCKYETNAAFGRRRIPYTSSEILERPKEEPKKSLDPDEDDKLTGDMRELYDRLLPSEESSRRRLQFVEKLKHILHTEFPGNEFNVHVFGSSGNMLYTSESDVDICIQTPMTRLEEMHMLAEALDKHGMERVVCIPGAKVRIVKVWDPELELASDMNVNNTLALENTRMIRTYVNIDERVRKLAMVVKYWTKQRILNDAGKPPKPDN